MSLPLNPADWASYIPCNEDYQIPIRCRPEFLDLTTLTGGVILPKFSADPTGYKAVNGSIYYNTIDQTLYYKNASGFQQLGVSGAPAPPVFPLEAVSATDATQILTSTVLPDGDPTFDLLADGTYRVFNGLGTLLNQIRYDAADSEWVYEFTAGAQDGAIKLSTVRAASMVAPAVANIIGQTGLQLATNAGSFVFRPNNGIIDASTSEIEASALVTGTITTTTTASIGTTLTAGTMVFTPKLDSPSNDIDCSNNIFRNISTMYSTVADVSGNVVTPRVTYGGTMLIDCVGNLQLGPSTGVIEFPTNNTMTNLTLTATLVTPTISTPVITTTGTDINVSGKNFTNIGSVTAGFLIGTINTNTIAINADADIEFVAGVTNYIAMTNSKAVLINRLQTTAGDMTITPFGNLILNKVVDLTATGTVTAATITATGTVNGSTIAATSAATAPTFTAATSITTPALTVNGTGTGTTLRATAIQAKYGDTTYYNVPIVWFNKFEEINMTSGTQTYQTKTVPASFMGTNGDAFEITVEGSTANNGTAKTVGITLGGTTMVSYSLEINTSSLFSMTFRIVRRDASNVLVGGVGVHNGVSKNLGSATIGRTLNTALALAVLSGTASNSDISMRHVRYVFYPAQAT